jgi:DNA-binding CsgD family transcriptional regulator
MLNLQAEWEARLAAEGLPAEPRRRVRTCVLYDKDTAATPPSTPTQQEVRENPNVQLVRRNLARMPRERHRQVLTWYMFDGKSQAQIGEALHISQPSVHRLLATSRATLKVLLKWDMEFSEIPDEDFYKWNPNLSSFGVLGVREYLRTWCLTDVLRWAEEYYLPHSQAVWHLRIQKHARLHPEHRISQIIIDILGCHLPSETDRHNL